MTTRDVSLAKLARAAEFAALAMRLVSEVRDELEEQAAREHEEARPRKMTERDVAKMRARFRQLGHGT